MPPTPAREPSGAPARAPDRAPDRAPATDADRAFAVLDAAIHALDPRVAREDRAGTARYALPGRDPFAVLRPLRSRVDVGFSRLGRARSKRILDARVAHLPGVRYRVIVEAPGDVDRELVTWLRESLEAFDGPDP